MGIYRGLLASGLTALACLSILGIMTPALSQAQFCSDKRKDGVLTCANIYRVVRSFWLQSTTGAERKILSDGKARSLEAPLGVIRSNGFLGQTATSKAVSKIPPRLDFQFNDFSIVRMRGEEFLFKAGRTIDDIARIDLRKGGKALLICEEGARVSIGITVAEIEPICNRKDLVAKNLKQKDSRVNNSVVSVIYVEGNDKGEATIFVLAGSAKFSSLQGVSRQVLKAGEQSSANRDGLGKPQEFNVADLTKSEPLLSGLGPGQEKNIEQEEPIEEVRETLYAARKEVEATINSQDGGFASNFLEEALLGKPSSNFGLRTADFEVEESRDGVFIRDTETAGRFIDNRGASNNLEIDFSNRTLSIDGNEGRASSWGLNGQNASGTVVDSDGTVTRIEVFGVDGNEPPIGRPYPGRLQRGRMPDR